MSLDISLKHKTTYSGHLIWEDDWSGNITHNLGEMASACGLYEPLWRPYLIFPNEMKEDDWKSEITGSDIYPHILTGLRELLSNPNKYKALNPENGRGRYEGLVKLAANYLAACEYYPDSYVCVDR